jgi:AraC-like DNA-binding protein
MAEERLYVRLPSDDSHGPESSAPAGTLADAPISAALSRYVSSITTYREDFADREALERVLPDGALRLVFNLADAPSTGEGAGYAVAAVGASTAPALVRLTGRVDGVSVTLRPGAAAVLLGVPAGELTEHAVHLDTLWNGDGNLLLEQLAEAPSYQARVRRLEAALLTRLRRAEERVYPSALRAAQLIAKTAGSLSLQKLAETVGVGERRLQQLFQAHVGLSPRAFSRLARLHACLRALRRTPLPPWAELAVDAGYYDQAHLANEFRALSGLSPSAFLERAVSGSSKTAP